MFWETGLLGTWAYNPILLTLPCDAYFKNRLRCVELGKVPAKRIISEIEDTGEARLGHDGSTDALSADTEN